MTLLPTLVLTWIVYLGLPFSLHPNFVIFPFAVLFALALAITAAEMGALVFGTLHTNNASKTIDRLIDAFPPAGD